MLKPLPKRCYRPSDPINIPNPSTPGKSMEDVWSDLSLPASFSDHPTPSAAATGNRSVFQGLNLHDFLLSERDPATTPAAFVSNTSTATLPLACSAPNQLTKKRARGEDGEDTRHKRMVKNRESAARSRARRQAYTYELELAIANLQKENARLKRLLENKDLCLPKEAPAVQPPEKHSLQRTLTAPF